jgi:hypothetical protein
VVAVLEETSTESLGGLLAEFGALLAPDAGEALSVFAASPQKRVVKLRLRDGIDELDAARRLMSSPLVATAEPNTIFKADITTPNDTFYNQQWSLHGAYGVGADAAWDLQRGSAGLVLAAIVFEVDDADVDGRDGKELPFFHFLDAATARPADRPRRTGPTRRPKPQAARQ